MLFCRVFKPSERWVRVVSAGSTVDLRRATIYYHMMPGYSSVSIEGETHLLIRFLCKTAEIIRTRKEWIPDEVFRRHIVVNNGFHKYNVRSVVTSPHNGLTVGIGAGDWTYEHDAVNWLSFRGTMTDMIGMFTASVVLAATPHDSEWFFGGDHNDNVRSGATANVG